MTKESAWNIFKNTGNINAFLELKQIENLENNQIQTNKMSNDEILNNKEQNDDNVKY